MGRRRMARECALQILFQLEFESDSPDLVVDRYWEYKKKMPEPVKEYGNWLVQGILAKQKEVDRLVQACSEHWRLSRMAAVDRNILRIAAFELMEEKEIAPAVIIDEAIEIAKKYSGTATATFINGVLDAVRKKMEKERALPEEGQNERRKGPPGKGKSKPPARRAKAERPGAGPSGKTE